ncbi:protein giant-lens-like isoform X1 [Homarus americanus]|uniref:protein giant-lens-like isoform X1 n=1 Tax=Homarus americanus TaxID=6706 RepID=UPI001C4522F6|nr:protein giant-lens-like isoform X1 [Homarus americanus]
MLSQRTCDLLLRVSTVVILAAENAHTSRLPPSNPLQPLLDHTPTYDQHSAYRVFYQSGKTEKELPVCSPWSVCNKVDTYDSPRVERQCRCPGGRTCSATLNPSDGHTITDKTRQFKLCEPIKKLPKCRYFRDVTWTFITYPDNVTQQITHCVCPKNSVAYIIKRQAYQTDQGIGFQYSFACSPQSRLRCQRKEPCRLFTVKKRPQFEEVNTNTLCQCPHGHRCPRHHMDPGVIPGKTYTEDSIRTYSGYCM